MKFYGWDGNICSDGGLENMKVFEFRTSLNCHIRSKLGPKRLVMVGKSFVFRREEQVEEAAKAATRCEGNGWARRTMKREWKIGLGLSTVSCCRLHWE
jgi:hypothetical protein